MAREPGDRTDIPLDFRYLARSRSHSGLIRQRRPSRSWSKAAKTPSTVLAEEEVDVCRSRRPRQYQEEELAGDPSWSRTWQT